MWGFHGGVSRVRVRSPFDLGRESWSVKLRVYGIPVCENRMILRSLVLTHYQRLTDIQTRHLQCINKLCCSVVERDKRHFRHTNDVADQWRTEGDGVDGG